MRRRMMLVLWRMEKGGGKERNDAKEGDVQVKRNKRGLLWMKLNDILVLRTSYVQSALLFSSCLFLSFV